VGSWLTFRSVPIQEVGGRKSYKFRLTGYCACNYPSACNEARSRSRPPKLLGIGFSLEVELVAGLAIWAKGIGYFQAIKEQDLEWLSKKAVFVC